MRWEELFDDLSAQGAAAEAAELDAEIADRGRHQAGRTGMTDRLRGRRVHSLVTIGLPTGERLTGSLLAVGLDWVAVGAGSDECLVPLAAIRWLQLPADADGSAAGIASLDAPAGGRVQRRLGLLQAVRYLVRDRTFVSVRLVDGEVMSGTADRASLDHLELAQHPRDVPRRASSVQAIRLVPYAGISSIRGGQVWSAS